MAKKKKPFRFRFPWFSEASAPRPKDESKSREKADTSVPIQESSEKAPAQSLPTQHKEVPIDEHQQHSPSHSHQPDKTFSISIESSQHSLSEPESLPFQPRSPAHSAVERTGKESRLTAVESTSQAKSPHQQAKEEMVVSESVPQPKESPLKTIPKSPEVTQPEISSRVTDSVPQPKDSPLKSISKSPKQTQPESSPHVPESMPQSKDSPLISVPKSQELTQPESPRHVFEPVPQPDDSQLKSISKSQEPTQISSQVSELVPQPKKSPLTSSQVFEPVSQPEVFSHVSEPIPQLKESPSETIPKSQDLTQQTIPKSPKTSPKNKKYELDSNREDTKSVLEAQRKFHQNEENEKVEHTEEGKAKDAMTRLTEAELHEEASVSETRTKDSFSKAFRTDWQKQDIEASIERKLMYAVSNSSGKDIKVISSVDPMTKSKSNNFHQMDDLSNMERTPMKKGIKEDILKFVQKLEIGQPTYPMEDKPVSAITLAGENRGATMQIGSKLTKKEGSVHIQRAYKTDPEEIQEVTTDAEEGSNDLVEQDEVGKTYVNSNIQSINNSLMYHGSITEKDPGVQLVLPPKPPEPIHSDDEDSKG